MEWQKDVDLTLVGSTSDLLLEIEEGKEDDNSSIICFREMSTLESNSFLDLSGGRYRHCGSLELLVDHFLS